MNTIGKGLLQGTQALLLSGAMVGAIKGVVTLAEYLDKQQAPIFLENAHPLLPKYDKNMDQYLDETESLELIINEFDNNKNGYLEDEELRTFNKFFGSFGTLTGPINISYTSHNLIKARRMLREMPELNQPSQSLLKKAFLKIFLE